MAYDKFSINGYIHDGVPLNLSGERDEDGCFITKITAADSEIDLFDLFPVSTIDLMAQRIEPQLEIEARQANEQARAERHQWDREFSIGAAA